jgi:hypothetical protein
MHVKHIINQQNYIYFLIPVTIRNISVSELIFIIPSQPTGSCQQSQAKYQMHFEY